MLGLIVLVSLACGAAKAQPPGGVKVHMHGMEGYAADGTLYTPKGEPPFAAIVLVPDERGVTNRLDQAVSRFSDRGFLVVALDLNRGLAPSAATHLEADALHDLDATLTFVGSQASVRRDAVGLIGWGSGGNHALGFAADPRVKAVVMVDTLPPFNLTGAGKSSAPVLAVIPGRNTETLQLLETGAKKLGLRLTIKKYSKADHDFDDPDDADHYNAMDALELGKLELSFFSAALRP